MIDYRRGVDMICRYVDRKRASLAALAGTAQLGSTYCHFQLRGRVKHWHAGSVL